jgi:outer membrane usher protein FimD/PapC
MIQSRGLNINLNRYFARLRFLPGTHSVQVKINGKDKGTVAARFGEDGTLCVDNDFIEFAGLMPVPLKKMKSAMTSLMIMRRQWLKPCRVRKRSSCSTGRSVERLKW